MLKFARLILFDFLSKIYIRNSLIFLPLQINGKIRQFAVRLFYLPLISTRMRGIKMDKIYIRDLEFIGYHGVFEEEKKLGQKFFVSLELTTNLREAGLNDDITKTTHYGEVSESVKKIFFQKKYDLIETLAEDIAREVLLNYPLISELKLEIKKPWAPVGIPLKDVSVEITRKWNEVYISLGSNMGNKKENLEKAIKEVAKIKDTFIIKESKIIETEPFGYKEQDDFLNSCIGVKTLLTPREILKELLAIEIRMGRERKIKWGPRIIDLDIIFYGKEVIEEDDLIVPHPYMEYREFVLKPLEEIIPNFVHPLLSKRISTLRKELENEKN